jgi:hypothetical protein
MKKTKIIYWIFTGLLCAGLLSSSIPELMGVPQATTFITNLGYPAYLVMFLAIARILAVGGILIPKFPQITEWAYAGIAFDLVGATYSQIAMKLPPQAWGFMSIWFIVFAFSYIFYHKKLKATV